jgi:hypothetical protein
LEAQQHKKYPQTTPLDDGVSSLFFFVFISLLYVLLKKKSQLDFFRRTTLEVRFLQIHLNMEHKVTWMGELRNFSPVLTQNSENPNKTVLTYVN